jgi:hypothetical protein
MTALYRTESGLHRRGAEQTRFQRPATASHFFFLPLPDLQLPWSLQPAKTIICPNQNKTQSLFGK